MRKHSKGLTRGVLVGASLLLASGMSMAATGTTPVQNAGGGATADEYARKSDLGFQWSGDVRERVDVQAYSHRNNPLGTGAFTRVRLRTRLRVGAKGTFGDNKAFWGFGLATNAGDPVSRNITLGGGDVNGTGGLLGIDLAYIGWRPHADVDLVLGKMPNPIVTTDAIMDGDLTPEGAAVNWQVFRGSEADLVNNVVFTSGYYALREIGAEMDDPFAILNQLRGDVGSVELGLGLYYFGNLNPTAGPTALPIGGQLGTQLQAGALPSNEMAVIDGRIRYPFEIGNFPITLGGNAFANLIEESQQFGWEVRADMPRVWKGNASLTVRDVGQFAAFSPWVDSDFGEGTGYHAGVRANYTHPLSRNTNVSLTYFHYDRFQPLSAPGTGALTTNRFMADFNARF
ncbi:MAG: putative porin [Armatimonadetes bacterium]|nr:putative porin [Armatimonadota bacterium]